MKECEGVRELQWPHESNKQTVVLPLQNMICGCGDLQKNRVGGRVIRGVTLQPSGSAV
jgi:hypothetical protein